MKESLFADLILPLIVWTGMGIGEVIFATLVLVAIIINKSLHKTEYFFIENLRICDFASSFTVNFMVTGTTIHSLIDRRYQGTNCRLVNTLYFPSLPVLSWSLCLSLIDLLLWSFLTSIVPMSQIKWQ